MDCSHQAPPSMEYFQARVLGWVAISFSGGSSRSGGQAQVSHIAGRCFTFWTTREAHTVGPCWLFVLHIVGCTYWSFLLCSTFLWDFPGSSVVKNPPANAGGLGLILEWGRSPGGENVNPLQYSCLWNPMDRGTWQATVHEVTKSRTRLSDWAHTQSLMLTCSRF